jgi:hypothetical protein
MRSSIVKQTKAIRLCLNSSKAPTLNLAGLGSLFGKAFGRNQIQPLTPEKWFKKKI